MIRLENKTDAPVAEFRELVFGKRGQVLPGKMDLTRIRRVQTADQMQQRAFARAGRAAQRERLTAHHVQINATQNFKHTLAHRVGLGQAAGGE